MYPTTYKIATIISQIKALKKWSYFKEYTKIKMALP